MSNATGLIGYISHADIVVQLVMLLLVAASIMSWMLIFQRINFLKLAKRDARTFEDQFWSGADLSQIYERLDRQNSHLSGLESIFYAGFKEFSRITQKTEVNSEAVMESTERAMRIAQAREQDKLERHLSFLATVGSTSPYVGLFGTVWGIMVAFHALGQVQQATISMVAPGISEALIATAMGLFAAIPAVVAYNRFNNQAEHLGNQYATFQEEFSSLLHRQVQN